MSFSLLFLSPQKTKTKAKNSSYLARVVVGVGRVHQRDDVADRLEVRCQGLAAQQPHALPKRLEHVVERVDAVGGRGLGERGQREPRHRPDLGRARVGEPPRDHGHQRAQVREHAAAQEDRGLLHDFDARVPRLP